jgi:hypothetical protein
MYTGHEKIFDMVDRVKGRTNNSEGTGGTWMYQSKRKKKNLRQTRALPCVRFRFLPAEMGEWRSCTQQLLSPRTSILYHKSPFKSTFKTAPFKEQSITFPLIPRFSGSIEANRRAYYSPFVGIRFRQSSKKRFPAHDASLG